MTTKRRPTADKPLLWRIGEVAKLTGVTPRTLRYWEELELLHPTSYGNNGARFYSPSDLARVNRIRNLQDLLGFSLSEVGAVLDTEEVDVLDRVHFKLVADNLPPARRKALLDEAIVANDQLLARLADTMSRIRTFREERAAIAIHLREVRSEIDKNKNSCIGAGRK